MVHIAASQSCSARTALRFLRFFSGELVNDESRRGAVVVLCVAHHAPARLYFLGDADIAVFHLLRIPNDWLGHICLRRHRKKAQKAKLDPTPTSLECDSQYFENARLYPLHNDRRLL